MDNYSALHKAVQSGQLTQVNDLLCRGEGDPSAVNPNTGQNALHVACEGGHVSIAKRLREIAVPLLQRDGAGLTPLGLAKRAGQEKVLDALLPQDSPFEAALLLWDAEEANQLVETHGYEASLAEVGELQAFYSENFNSLFACLYGTFERKVVHPTLHAVRKILED